MPVGNCLEPTQSLALLTSELTEFVPGIHCYKWECNAQPQGMDHNSDVVALATPGIALILGTQQYDLPESAS